MIIRRVYNRKERQKGKAIMTTGFLIRWRVPALGILMIVTWLAPLKFGIAAETGEQVFNKSCAGCHTIGEKVLGPDLTGVTSRREAGWLVRQIKEPEKLIAEKDPIAMQLLEEFNNLSMPAMGLSDAQVSAVISYLQSIDPNKVVGFNERYPEYVPTVIISILLLIVLTWIGLVVGRKKVDVR